MTSVKRSGHLMLMMILKVNLLLFNSDFYSDNLMQF